MISNEISFILDCRNRWAWSIVFWSEPVPCFADCRIESIRDFPTKEKCKENLLDTMKKLEIPFGGIEEIY